MLQWSKWRRQTFAIALSVTAWVTLAGFLSLSWRSPFGGASEVSISWRCPGADAEKVEREMLYPLEAAVRQTGALHILGTAAPGSAQVVAEFAHTPDTTALRRLFAESKHGSSSAAPEFPPQISVVQLRSESDHDWPRALLMLAVALAVPSALAVLTNSRRHQDRSALRALLEGYVEQIVDRFQDALAWALGHRGRVVLLLLFLGISVPILAAAARRAASPAPVPAPANAADWSVDIYGEDLQTLVGVTRRVADEARRLSSVRSVEVAGPAGMIQHRDGRRSARLNLMVTDRHWALGGVIDSTLQTMLLPAGHSFVLDGPIAEEHRAERSVQFVAALSLFVLVTLVAIRHRNVVAPASVAAGIPLALVGSAAAFGSVTGGRDPWLWLGAALPAVMFVWRASALFRQAEQSRAMGTPLRVSLIDAARGQFRPLVLATAAQTLLLAGYWVFGDSRLAPVWMASLGGVVTAAATVAFATPVTYEVALRTASRWRTWRLLRRLWRREAT